MEISNEVMTTLERVLVQRGVFATKTELDRAVADVVRRTREREARGSTFSLSRMVRGLCAAEGHSLNDETRDADMQYVRALTTGSTPGSYLVPTQQANEILAMLSLGGVARAAGARVVPMSGLQKLTIPRALTAPTWLWMAQTSAQQATDPNLGQVAFDLKTRRCLVETPNELLRSSVPALDTLLAQIIAQGAAEHEDAALFATSTVSGGPTAFMSTASITTLNANGNDASGGSLLYTDILAVLAKTTAVKARGPYAWFMSGRTWWLRINGLLDASSRPIAIPTGVSGLAAAVAGTLMGYPVYVSPAIPEDESVGSGSNQSHLILCNPANLMIAEGGAVEVAVSTEFLFSSNMTAIRAVHMMDAAVGQPAGFIALKGID